jgi:hypothetical protein
MEIQGSFRVIVPYIHFNVPETLYSLIFTNDRIIAAKLSELGPLDSHGSAGVGAGSLLGILGSFLEAKEHQKTEASANEIAKLAPERLLDLNSDNFQILYQEIEKIEAKKRTFLNPWGTMKISGNLSSIKLWRKPPKHLELAIGKNQEYQAWIGVLEKALPGKIKPK